MNPHRYESDPAAFQDDIHLDTGTGIRRFGDAMAGFQRERFKIINPGLLSVSRHEVPRKARIWDERTKGASKDTDWAVNILWLMAMSRRSLRIQVGAYDQQQADESRLIIKGLLKIDTPLNRWLGEVLKVKANTVSNLHTGSEVEILTTDTLGSHGARPDLVLLDELTHQRDQEFASTLMDNADKMPASLVAVATNAGFLGTWQEEWRNGFLAAPDRWEVLEYRGTPPWITDAALRDAKRRNKGNRFKRLWRGLWVSGRGDALREEDIDKVFRPGLSPLDGAEKGWRYIAALDIGVHRDHTGLIVVGVNEEERRIRVAKMHDWAPDEETGKVDLVAVKDTCLEECGRFGPERFFYDPSQAELMVQELTAEGMPMDEMRFVPANLTLMAETLIQVVEGNMLECYEDERLRRDFGKFDLVEKSYGYRLEATSDVHGHADVGTALVMCLPRAVEILGVTDELRPDDVLADDGRPLTKREVDAMDPELKELWEFAGDMEEDEYVDMAGEVIKWGTM